jgi:hypothetical protein
MEFGIEQYKQSNENMLNAVIQQRARDLHDEKRQKKLLTKRIR